MDKFIELIVELMLNTSKDETDEVLNVLTSLQMNCLGICSECECDCELREEEFKSEDK